MGNHPQDKREVQAKICSVTQSRSHDDRMSEVFGRMSDGCILVTIVPPSKDSVPESVHSTLLNHSHLVAMMSIMVFHKVTKIIINLISLRFLVSDLFW